MKWKPNKKNNNWSYIFLKNIYHYSFPTSDLHQHDLLLKKKLTMTENACDPIWNLFFPHTIQWVNIETFYRHKFSHYAFQMGPHISTSSLRHIYIGGKPRDWNGCLPDLLKLWHHTTSGVTINKENHYVQIPKALQVNDPDLYLKLQISF